MFGFFDWFGLVLRTFCIKEMVRFQRSCYQIGFKNPIHFFFCYRLSYNHPNGVIIIVKEP